MVYIKKVKVNILGNSNSERSREFEILERSEIEKIIDETSLGDIFLKALELAESYNLGGTAYAYINAENGEVETCWLGRSSYLHPWDEFQEIQLCRIHTPPFEPADVDLLDTDGREWGVYEEWTEKNNGMVEEFIEETMGEEELKEKIENWKEYLASEFQFDYENIEEQLDALYQRKIN